MPGAKIDEQGKLATAIARTFTVPEEKLLDATERLLIDIGYAAISTRRVAAEARVNHGLVHYYFGSMDELFLQVLERFTGRLLDRQREMYAAEQPFIEKWRTAMRYLEEDFASGYQKVWLELQALAWNRRELRARVARVNAEWRQVLVDAFADAASGHGVDTSRFPVDALVTLVSAFNQGLILEMHSGVTTSHSSLLQMVDRFLVDLEGWDPS